ncbi:MAG: polysaccharide deacetylase family protein [Planctomycetota bacterium]|nr:polysaccharide deacetylase family protein [Planctomycetota bacterium]
MRTATLLYHDVVPADQLQTSGFQGAVADRYKLSCDSFDAHLRAIVGRPLLRCETVTRLMSSSSDDGCPCLFTFDDGGVSALTEIAERLEAAGWRGRFFIPTDHIGQPGFLSAEQIRELHQRGHIIGTHSCSHPRRIDQLNDSDLQREWSQSTEILANVLQSPIECGSVPGGFFSRRVAEAASRAGLKVLFNSEPTCRWKKPGSLWIAGRLPIVNHTSASMAAALATGDRHTITQQQLVWNGKKLAKTVAGGLYRQVSEWIFSQK